MSPLLKSHPMFQGIIRAFEILCRRMVVPPTVRVYFSFYSVRPIPISGWVTLFSIFWEEATDTPLNPYPNCKDKYVRVRERDGASMVTTEGIGDSTPTYFFGQVIWRCLLFSLSMTSPSLSETWFKNFQVYMFLYPYIFGSRGQQWDRQTSRRVYYWVTSLFEVAP